MSSPLSPAPGFPLHSLLEALPPQALPGSSTCVPGRDKAKRAAHLLESILGGKSPHDDKNECRALAWHWFGAGTVCVRSCSFPMCHRSGQTLPSLQNKNRGVTEKQPTFPRSQLGFKCRLAGSKPSAQPLHAPAQQASAVRRLPREELGTAGVCPGQAIHFGLLGEASLKDVQLWEDAEKEVRTRAFMAVGKPSPVILKERKWCQMVTWEWQAWAGVNRCGQAWANCAWASLSSPLDSTPIFKICFH